MQKAVLVAYASNAGSTADVAKAVGEELARDGARVDVRSISELSGADVSGYDAVVVGAPMILGWHRTRAASSRRTGGPGTSANSAFRDSAQPDEDR